MSRTINPFAVKPGVRVKRGPTQKELQRKLVSEHVERTASPGYQRYFLSSRPPSLNNAFANTRTGRVKGSAYRAWVQEAGWEIARQKPVPVAGPFCVAIEVGETVSKADLDNLAKPIIDMLVEMGCVPDDRNMVLLQVERSDRSDVSVAVWTKGFATPAQQAAA
jgi:Holliday junction resolvase RusA-like endonuclease